MNVICEITPRFYILFKNGLLADTKIIYLKFKLL